MTSLADSADAAHDPHYERFRAALAETPTGLRVELGDAVYATGLPHMSADSFYAAIQRYEATVGWSDTYAQARVRASRCGLIMRRKRSAA